MRLPPYAYLPGQTPRHDPSMLAEVTNSVRPGMTVSELTECTAWRVGWDLFENGFFWEAHEVLESIWMATGPNSAERYFVQALIQTANAALKMRMARPRATLKLCDIAMAHLDSCVAPKRQVMGKCVQTLLSRINELKIAATQGMQNNA